MNFSAIIPPWLDQNLFEKAFRSYENDPSAQVHDFKVEAATQPGENFASAVFRGKIKFSSKFSKGEKEISVIIKTKPVMEINENIPEEMRQQIEVFHNSNLFDTEMAMYGSVLPLIENLLHSINERDVVWPKLIYQTNSPKPVIILEDVTVNGYDTMIKTFHEDFEISKIIFERLAKYHAASFYLEKEQKYDTSLFSDAFYKREDVINGMFGQSIDFAIATFSSWEGFEQYVQPLMKFKENFIEKSKKSYSPANGPNAFNVLNHGDFHIRNLLYKMKPEGQGIEDFVFLDFQIAVRGTPAIDLYYALYNFISAENRHNRYDEILQIYHEKFTECLKKFGYLKPPPSLIDLHVEMMKNGNVQVILAICAYAILMLDLSTLTPEELALGMGGMAMKAAQNPKFKEIMRKELPMFLHKGFLC
ncbi:hypothetical protein PVAND_017072 [Polypedilum vanderplanki]|uniref:CHK kinase-like domain-containing protein n=1 Tax=Polypedilum vanderplanki TaxID=319348 RepID=A0A9J6BHJ0_POLVA|nr:hypothetical protein PVAND_017072 [Polypedilum vanderplanki]